MTGDAERLYQKMHFPRKLDCSLCRAHRQICTFLPDFQASIRSRCTWRWSCCASRFCSSARSRSTFSCNCFCIRACWAASRFRLATWKVIRQYAEPSFPKTDFSSPREEKSPLFLYPRLGAWLEMYWHKVWSSGHLQSLITYTKATGDNMENVDRRG